MKLIRTITLSCWVILNCTGSSLANNTMTAKGLLTACTTPKMNWVDFCNGYFQAVHDQQSSVGTLCTPPETTRTNLVEIYEEEASKLITQNPNQGIKPAFEIAAKVLVNRFPCR